MKTFLTLAVLSSLALETALAAVNVEKFPSRMPTRLSAEEIAREVKDEETYPNVMRVLRHFDITSGINPVDPRNKHLIKTTHVFSPTQGMWKDFFQAAAKDKITVLRAFSLLAREIKKDGIVVFGPGRDFENAVRDNKVDLGLALPAKNVGTAIWSPDPDNKDPEFQAHLKVFYTESYVHRFPDNILPANLKIGYGESDTYWMEGKQYTQPTIDADIYYGPTKGVGFRNVKGVGGQKRGLMGFFQKVLFFLPDAVDSMLIDESKGVMVTEALVNTTVEEFEKNPVYAIKIAE